MQRECEMSKTLRAMKAAVPKGDNQRWERRKYDRFVECKFDGTAYESPFIVMPFIEDPTLEDHMASNSLKQPATEQRTDMLMNLIHVGWQLFQSLSVIEDKFAHKDLKPANIMVNDKFQVTIIDLGLMTEIGAKDGSGTPITTPPEAAGENYEVKATWDVFSVGATLLETLCGTSPFYELLEHMYEEHKAEAEVEMPVTWMDRLKGQAGKKQLQQEMVARELASSNIFIGMENWLELKTKHKLDLTTCPLLGNSQVKRDRAEILFFFHILEHIMVPEASRPKASQLLTYPIWQDHKNQEALRAEFNNPDFWKLRSSLFDYSKQFSK